MGGGKPRWIGHIRTVPSMLPALMAAFGQPDGAGRMFYIEIMEIDDKLPVPFNKRCNVEVQKKPNGTTHHDHAINVAKLANDMGIFLGDNFDAL